jgi:hypothetical protein
MCGIFGSPTITPTVRAMLPYLGIAMQTRGRDAWGASDGGLVLKHKGPLTDSWGMDRELVNTWGSGIFHTRGASHGTPKEEENAHPFAYPKQDGTSVIGIHNGLVSNHDSLAKKYGRQCAVDSQHLWMHRASDLPWSDIQGWGNLAWWETTPEGERRINLCRFNTDNLKVARLEGGEFVFASETQPISTMASMLGNPVKHWVNIDEYYHYWFRPSQDGRMDLWRGHKLEFGKVPVVVNTSNSVVPFIGHHPGPGRGSYTQKAYCYGCNTVRVQGDEDVLCFSCLRSFMQQYLAVGTDDSMWNDMPTVGAHTHVGHHAVEAHLRLKTSGNIEKIKCFHWILAKLDPDYPYAPASMRRYPNLVTCDLCHGAVYYSPMLTPEQMKYVGRQVHDSLMIQGSLKVGVKMYNKHCPGGQVTNVVEMAAGAAS